MAVVQATEGDLAELDMAYAVSWLGVSNGSHISVVSQYAFVHVDLQ